MPVCVCLCVLCVYSVCVWALCVPGLGETNFIIIILRSIMIKLSFPRRGGQGGNPGVKRIPGPGETSFVTSLFRMIIIPKRGEGTAAAKE